MALVALSLCAPLARYSQEILEFEPGVSVAENISWSACYCECLVQDVILMALAMLVLLMARLVMVYQRMRLHKIRLVFWREICLVLRNELDLCWVVEVS